MAVERRAPRGWTPACFGAIPQTEPECAACPIIVECQREYAGMQESITALQRDIADGKMSLGSRLA